MSKRFKAQGAAGRSCSQGAVAVEFALIVPLLVMLLLGTVTGGLAYSKAIGLTNAVREGARFGATTQQSGTWADDVVTRTRAMQFDDHASPPDTLVCAELREVGVGAAIRTSGSCTGDREAPVTPAGFQSGDCFVWVAGSRDYSILLGVFPQLDGTTTRTSAARYERECP
jgi:Flp pilus assembly protein TadG